MKYWFGCTLGPYIVKTTVWGNASEIRGSFAPRMKLVIDALLLGLLIDFIYPKEICTKFRGLSIIAFLFTICMGPIVELTEKGISYDV